MKFGVKVGNVMENVSLWPRVGPLSENLGRDVFEFGEILVNLTHRHVFNKAVLQNACNTFAMHCNTFARTYMTDGRLIASRRATHTQLMGHRGRTYTTNAAKTCNFRAVAN